VRPEDLRTRLRGERRSLPADDRLRASAEIAARLGALRELVGGGTLGTYLPTDGELDPNHGLAELRRRGWRPYLPTIGRQRSMRFAEWTTSTDLVANRFGIAEPDVGDGERIDAVALDVVIVPCVAVDPSGNRLGFGAGYYDRALAGVLDGSAGPVRIGVAYDAAVVDELAPRPWDVPVNLIVTERRVLRA
jgi:5-formyltetrahydrofolate cyclo-ligase